MVDRIQRNVDEVLENMARAAEKAGRRREEIRLVGVSKLHPREAMEAAEDTGIFAFGENRVQEAWEKHKGWKGERKIPWHMIGHLQRNKASRALEIFDGLHSLDSSRLARELEKHLAPEDRLFEVLLEVNTSGEAAKHGLDAEEALPLLEDIRECCPHLAVRGLMTMAPLGVGEAAVRRCFGNLRQLRDRLQERTGQSLPELSMGMSGDYPWAILEGSTLVRVGTAIFGSR